jgi:Queuine tRNA-ribosyltransferase
MLIPYFSTKAALSKNDFLELGLEYVALDIDDVLLHQGLIEELLPLKSIIDDSKVIFDKHGKYKLRNQSGLVIKFSAEDIYLAKAQTTTNLKNNFNPSTEMIDLAHSGKFYCGTEIFDLMQPEFTLDLQPLDPSCTCSSCQTTYTRSYLQHLHQHVPLLCHRLVAIHNIYNKITCAT